MSNTYSLVCEDCRVRMEFGQDNLPWIGYEQCQNFLHTHVGCNIRFLIDQVMSDDVESYTELDPNGGVIGSDPLTGTIMRG